MSASSGENGQEAALRALLEASPDLIFFLDEQSRCSYAGTAAAAVFGLTRDEMRGRTLGEAGMAEPAASALVMACRTAFGNDAPVRGELTFSVHDASSRVIDYVIAPLGGGSGGVVMIARDLTEQRRAEAHDRFLSSLSDQLLGLVDADEIMIVTARKLGEYLGVNRCAYAEVAADEDHFTITGDYTRETFSILGDFALSAFGPAHEAALEGRPFVVSDAATDPRLEQFREAYRQTDIAAVVQVTLKKDGRFVAGMAVHQKVPREWRTDELELIQVVINRCWESLERARATRLLSVSEERYRSLMSVLTAVVWTTDARGAFVTEQKSWETYTGQRPEEYAQFGWIEAIHVDDRPQLLERWERAVAQRSVYRAGGRMWHAASRSYRWFEVVAAPLLDNGGNIREWIGTVSDVHERHESQLRAAEERQWLQMALDLLPVSTVFIEPVTARVVFANRAAAESIGAAAGEGMIELWPFALSDLDGRGLADHELPSARIARGERLEGVQMISGTPNGERTLLVRGEQLPASHGHPAVGVMTVLDISELKAIEAELRRASVMKDEFLATVSHELRTPLTAIMGWASLLRSGGFDLEAQQNALKVIEQNARTQALLIDDLVDVSRIAAGKLNLHRSEVLLGEVIRRAIDSVALPAQARNVEIAQTIDDSLAVDGDPARLQQIVWNILSNAVRFTPDGGRIEISVRAAGVMSEIIVRDNGAGIAPEFLPHVFDRFRQGDMSTTRVHGGLGLGLAISQHLAQLHGGVIEAESEGTGRGATFRVRLPLVSGGRLDADDPPAVTADGGTLKDEKILVVDDQEDARNMIRIVLARAGASVEVAASAADAIDRLRTFTADLLITDIGMPGTDGYALLRQVRAGGHTMPAIALTAYAGEENARAALDAGFVRHVAKPSSPEQIVRTALEALATAGPADQTR